MSFTKKLVETIAQQSFKDCSTTVVGYGYMGKEYVKALQILNISSIHICSRREPTVESFSVNSRITLSTGGYQQLQREARPGELAIIATSTEHLISAAKHLRELGFKRFLIEKPLALASSTIQQFQNDFEKDGVEVICGYNRVAYPSFLEAKKMADEEGGITSCYYTMTEIVSPTWEERFPKEELARWGIANSLHVASMAHGLIGLPREWTGYQSGQAISWHPSGSVFVGSGISEKGIPFSYHADWTSKGRWSVEVHSQKASYLLCPLEKLFRRTFFKEPWTEVPIHALSEKVKVGIVEEVAAMLKPELRSKISLYSLEETLKLTQFGERIFGYAT